MATNQDKANKCNFHAKPFEQLIFLCQNKTNKQGKIKNTKGAENRIHSFPNKRFSKRRQKTSDMADSDVQIKVCQQEIVKLDLQVKAIIQVSYIGVLDTISEALDKCGTVLVVEQGDAHK